MCSASSGLATGDVGEGGVGGEGRTGRPDSRGGVGSCTFSTETSVGTDAPAKSVWTASGRRGEGDLLVRLTFGFSIPHSSSMSHSSCLAGATSVACDPEA